MTELKERCALVTGAARGIGFAIAGELARRGANVAICDIDEEQAARAAETLRSAGVKTLSGKVNVADAAAFEAFVDAMVDAWGRIDILVNNAGIMQGAPFVAFEPEDWRRVIEVNLMGTFYCTRFVAPMLIEQGWGRIINMASRSGKIGIPYLTAYVASKHGVVGFTKALAEELAPFNITVNAICPGTVETDMVPETVKQRIGELLIPPGHVADLALYLATDSAASINGEAINIYGRTKLDLSM